MTVNCLLIVKVFGELKKAAPISIKNVYQINDNIVKKITMPMIILIHSFFTFDS